MKRIRRRRSQEGSALFVVVMVITLLTSVGLYSMHSASLAEMAIGYNRQSVQAGYVSEFAARAVMSELVGKEQHYFRYISAGTDDCRANRQLATLLNPDRPPCYRLQASELWDRFDTNFPGSVGDATAPTLFGDMGRGDIEGGFIVEMTDLSRAGSPIIGEDVAADQFKFMQVLISATGQVRPGGVLPEDGTCDPAMATISTLQSLRTQITFGPVN